jgi:magnesium-transporting ATPase (P-type)
VKDSKGQYKLYIKGADNSMLPLLSSDLDHPFLGKSERSLEELACVGLRTLVFGVRLLTEEQMNSIMTAYKQAISSLDKKDRLRSLCYSVEKDIALLGITAIKDHLQEKVPESIARFVEANIKVWMITGDKLQTAESIAFSAGLFHSNMKTFTVNECSEDSFPKQAIDLKRRMQRVRGNMKKGILVDITLISTADEFLPLRLHIQAVNASEK